MADTLQDTIREVRRRAWIAKIFYSCGWILSIATGFLLLIAGVDFILRQDNRLSRITLTFIFVLAVVTFIARFLLPLVKQPLTDVILAQRIQQRFPMLQHKIATAVEFLQDEKNAAAGSGAMRRAVIREATDDLQDLPVREVVHYRHAWVAIVTGCISVATLWIVTLVLPLGSRIALERLMNPFGDTVWPQVNELVFQNTPSHVRRGGLFEAEIADRKNKLPDKVNIEYRFGQKGIVKTLVEPMNRVNGIMVAQRQNVQLPFQFRAVGGDDRTEWRDLQTVIPPTLDAVEFEVHPPAYTGWPVEKQTENVWGLAGSEVTITGNASVPLASATLIAEGGSPIRLKLDSSRLGFASGEETWRLKKTGTASLRMIDEHGIEGGEKDRISVRVIPESPPTVQIEKPAGYYRASSDAVLPLEIFAKDNLAIRDVKLHFQSAVEGTEKYKPILLLEQKPSRTDFDRALMEQQVAEGDQQLVKYNWDLAPYGWAAGTEISFYATAHDYQPAEGRSAPEHTLQIVEKEELAQEMALRQQGLLAELARIVHREKESNEQTTQLEIAWEQTEMFTQTDVQSLRGIELTEREIRRAMSDQHDGLLAKTLTLEADLKHNRMDDQGMSEQLQRLRQTLSRVESNQLIPLQSALNTARKHAQNDLATSSQANRQENRTEEGALALKQAGSYQKQAIELLQPLVNELLRFNQYRRMVGKLSVVTEQQKNIRETTEGLARALSGRPLEEMEANERIALKQTAEQQDTLNREIEGLLTRMQQAANDLETKDRDAGERLAATVKQGREQGLGQQMRAAQKHLEANQTGQAIAQQKQATKTLEEMLATLQGIEQKDLAKWIEKLRQAEAELARLAIEQQGIKKEQAAALSRSKTEATTTNRKELQAIQERRKTLEDKIRSLAERIEKLQAAATAKSLNAAANKTQQAGKAAGQGDASNSEQQDQAAGQHIEDARKQLNDARQQAEAAQLISQLARLPEQLSELIENQKDLLQKTKLSAQTNQRKPKLTRLDKANILDLSREQLALVARIQPMKEGLALAEILQYVLVGTEAKMQSAAEKLGKFQTGQETQNLQQDVIGQLEMVLTSLKKDTDEEEAEKQGGGGGAGQGGGPQEQGTERSLAEIRLLKLLQMDLNQRILSIQNEIQKVTNQKGDVEPLVEQLQQLGPKQAKLALWTLGLLRESNQNIENRDD
ncbi:MAG: hypothetical protein P8M53_00025, partial [Pirellulales bacterium]|nr:hypothetical protein [Pirellulales bacterium]